MSETFRPIKIDQDISGSYTDVMLLREGATSRLYRVSKGGKYFAIKTTKDNSGMQFAMLRREYELSIKLGHNHLPHFFTFETQSPVGPGIVMEYIDGRNLYEFLAENPSHDARKRVFAQLLEVVSYIHKNGIIHNDLKPENILITHANDDVKLLDFGLSDADAYYLTKAMGGTRNYASPELLAQSDDIDTRSDIYSIGKIMQLIFPKQYRSYWQKCQQKKRENRWDNIDQLYRQWNKSRRWIYYILGVAIAIAITIAVVASLLRDREVVAETQRQELLDSLSVARSEARIVQQQFDSIKTVQEKAEAAQRRWEEVKDSSINEMKRQFETRYLLAMDTLKRTPFSEFAYIVLGNYAVDINHIKNKCVSSAPDATIGSIMSSMFDNMSMEQFKTLSDFAKEKPGLRDKIEELGSDKIEFYDSLLSNGLPYREYSSK